jgi:hypothetical protein
MSEQSEPVAETEETEVEEAVETPEGAAPPLATDPILGDTREVDTIGGGPGTQAGTDIPNPHEAHTVEEEDREDLEAAAAQEAEPIGDGGQEAGV